MPDKVGVRQIGHAPDPAMLGPIGYGAANVGNLYRALTDDEAFAVLDAAWEAGIRYFDTAPHYGLGLSERRLGAFLASKSRDEFIISTKAGRLLRPNPAGEGRLDDANDFMVPATLRRVWDFSADGIRRSVEESLDRLGLDAVDIVYLHDPERNDVDPTPVETGIASLAALRAEHLVASIGVGSMSTDALLASARTGAIDLLMVAGRLTLADQPALAEVVPECRARSIGIVDAAIFNSGLLASSDPSRNARYDYGEVPPALLRKVEAIAAVARDYGVELPAAALQYPLREACVRTVVVGSSRPEQVRQNVARISAAIPEEFWSALAADGLIPA